MAKCISNLKKNKAALDTQKGANLGLKCVRMHLAAGLCPDPLGELECSPRPLAAIGGGVPTSNGEGRGKGKEGDGKGEREGRQGRERTTCYESIANWTPQVRKPSAAPDLNCTVKLTD